MPKGSSVIGFGMSVEVDMSITQIDFLVTFSSLFASGCPFVARFVFELV